MASQASGSSSPAFVSQTLPLASSSSFPSMPPTPPLHPLVLSNVNFLVKFPFSPETLPTPFSSELVRIYPFKIKSSEGPEAKSLISYSTWPKDELRAIVKDSPKVTEDPHRFAEEFNIVIQTYQPVFS